jgi:hypothetical protein
MLLQRLDRRADSFFGALQRPLARRKMLPERAPENSELGQSAVKLRNSPCEQTVHAPAARATLLPKAAQQLVHLVERQAERLSLFDEYHLRHSLRFVAPESSQRPRRGLQQMTPLVVTERFDRYACQACDLADAVGFGHHIPFFGAAD